jgi:phosphoribosylamine--glycine ligase
VLCAGVAADDQGRLVTAGGRVIEVVGQGPDVGGARANAYASLAGIRWPGMHHRTDIAREVATT